MAIPELIKSIKDDYSRINNKWSKTIGGIIVNAVNDNDAKNQKNNDSNTFAIKTEQDMDTIKTTSTGFYMLFASGIAESDETKQCSCIINCEGKKYRCVYRGHSFTLKDRINSHLFYCPDGKYPSCMHIKIDGKKYNINLKDKVLYENKQKNTTVTFPKWDWAAVVIFLPDSTEPIREMFESAFDNEYGKPIFSDK